MQILNGNFTNPTGAAKKVHHHQVILWHLHWHENYPLTQQHHIKQENRATVPQLHTRASKREQKCNNPLFISEATFC